MPPAPDAGPDAAAADVIVAEVRSFLRRGRVRGVSVAHGTIPPPQLAYLVSFPRLSLTLGGEDVVELEQAGQVKRLSLGRGDALFVPANAWNRPTWGKPVRVLTFLFGKRQTG